MRPLLVIGLLALALPIKIAASAFLEPGDKTPEQSHWRMDRDGTSGPRISYSAPGYEDRIKISCVGPSPKTPLMDFGRPYNLALAIETPAAKAWMSGREAFIMVLLDTGWVRAAPLAIHDSLVLDPETTEGALTRMTLNGVLKMKVVANTREGIKEEDISLPAANIAEALLDQRPGCSRIFSRR